MFYLKHRELIAMHTSYTPEMYLYAMYCRDTFCTIIPHESKTTKISLLTIHCIPTKYQLYDIVNASSANVCEFLIEIVGENGGKKLSQLSSGTYCELLKFSKYTDEYDKYFKIKQDTKNGTKEQKRYLEYFKLNSLDKLFKQMICEFYEKYVATYVNKLHSDEDIDITTSLEHKYRILFEIHFIHLQTNKPIFKCDVERIFLYIIESEIIIESLKQLHDFSANHRVQYDWVELSWVELSWLITNNYILFPLLISY